jgi:hypothetical protein
MAPAANQGGFFKFDVRHVRAVLSWCPGNFCDRAFATPAKGDQGVKLIILRPARILLSKVALAENSFPHPNRAIIARLYRVLLL